MPHPHPALAPAPALFDVTTLTATGIDGTLARLSLEQLELAENPRKTISADGIERLAAMLMRLGQLTPCLGWRPAPDQPVRLYDGQRRLLAAQASDRLAGTAGFEALAPVRSLIVLLLDHEPGREEILRIQAQANRSEELALVDQQAQFGDCWQARAGLREADRIAAVCADLGIYSLSPTVRPGSPTVTPTTPATTRGGCTRASTSWRRRGGACGRRDHSRLGR